LWINSLGTVFCQNDGKLPSFTWLEEESPFGVPLLKVGFPDGGSDEIIYLRKFNPIPVGSNERADSVDSCIYNGVLGTEKSHVTLTGCAKSNNFQVFIHHILKKLLLLKKWIFMIISFNKWLGTVQLCYLLPRFIITVLICSRNYNLGLFSSIKHNVCENKFYKF